MSQRAVDAAGAIFLFGIVCAQWMKSNRHSDLKARTPILLDEIQWDRLIVRI
ncbi:hypothetical protein [Paenibacillus silvestris]|uniref:hypothetical protein n=1 Tax=Paenibacillus silvestris TaxID=2606219 RepID=UPI001372D56A|nr:hypothetical protein [Paenibacillus silvestris]